VTISQWGNANPDLYIGSFVSISASSEYKALSPTSLIQFSILEAPTYEINEPPYFKTELESLVLTVEFGDEVPVPDDVVVDLP